MAVAGVVLAMSTVVVLPTLARGAVVAMPTVVGGAVVVILAISTVVVLPDIGNHGRLNLNVGLSGTDGGCGGMTTAGGKGLTGVEGGGVDKGGLHFVMVLSF